MKLGKVIAATPEAEKNKAAYITKRKAALCKKTACKTCATQPAGKPSDGAAGKKDG